MISIVIPLYNKEKVVLNTLASLQRQTFTDYEVILVNDGSTDTSLSVVEKWLDAASNHLTGSRQMQFVS